jgi:hypothetical protein
MVGLLCLDLFQSRYTVDCCNRMCRVTFLCYDFCLPFVIVALLLVVVMVAYVLVTVLIISRFSLLHSQYGMHAAGYSAGKPNITNKLVDENQNKQ